MNDQELERALNPDQQAAVRAPDGPVLVIAAAGTGKTRTLTYRVAWLVGHGVDPREILLLTFTNKAAQEMLSRARDLVGEAVGGLWGGTFHHTANRVLRRHAEALGYRPDYTILDQDDAAGLIRDAARELHLAAKHFPKPEVLLGVFSLAANTGRPLDEVAATRFADSAVDPADVLKVEAAYRQRKRALNAMDFDDLLVNSLALLRQEEALRHHYQHRFRYLLVDEYQDTNLLQAGWVDLLAEQHRNLLVVGDDFQSIYSWRGADFRNILSFPQRYEGAAVFKLELNYRSTPEILAVANACIAGNPEQFQKNLRAVRPTARRKPALVRCWDGRQQAQFVLDEVRRLRREGRPLDRVAVLYRAHFQAMELQLELSREQVPYLVTSGVRFFEQAHVKDACAVLRLAVNPADELAFLRLLELLPRVGARSARRVWEAIGGRLALAEAAQLEALDKKLPADARPAWRELVPVFRSFREAGVELRAGEMIAGFVKAFYREYAIENFDNADRRLEDLEELAAFTGRFESTEAFLSEIALLTNLDAEAEEVKDGATPALRLSTVHQAKGLEWDVVFILWLVDGLFPSSRSLEEPHGEAEERRLFYVAVTRARDQLYLCAPEVRSRRDGGLIPYMPSRFLREIEPDLLERPAARQRQAW